MLFFWNNITNNVAEYNGLLYGLKTLKSLNKNKKIDQLLIESHSNLLINQIIGNFKINSPQLMELYKQCKEIEYELNVDNINYQHILRSFNKEADKLANMAMNTKTTNINI